MVLCIFGPQRPAPDWALDNIGKPKSGPDWPTLAASCFCQRSSECCLPCCCCCSTGGKHGKNMKKISVSLQRDHSQTAAAENRLQKHSPTSKPKSQPARRMIFFFKQENVCDFCVEFFPHPEIIIQRQQLFPEDHFQFSGQQQQQSFARSMRWG